MSNAPALYTALRRSTALMLRLDPEALTPAQVVKVDGVSGLRLEMDRLQVAQMAGERIDPKALIAVTTELEAALQQAQPSEQQVQQGNYAREKLKQLIERNITFPAVTAESRIAQLEAEVARLQAELEEALSRSRAGAAPSADNIVPLHKPPASSQPSSEVTDWSRWNAGGGNVRQPGWDGVPRGW